MLDEVIDVEAEDEKLVLRFSSSKLEEIGVNFLKFLEVLV